MLASCQLSASCQHQGTKRQYTYVHTQPPCRAVWTSAVGTNHKVPVDELLRVAKKAASLGAEVVMTALDKPRAFSRKDNNDIVTETDTAAEKVVVEAIQAAFPAHAILGEEGGVLGDVSSEYLWCIDPLDGTCNFGSGYQSFCVSVGLLRHSTPVAGTVVEFIGGPLTWHTRTYAAARNGGATCDGQAISVSGTRQLRDALVATELVYYEDMWQPLEALLKDVTWQSRGVRMSGAAAANLCHLASGCLDAYYQFNLKPWDVAAGLLILEEAGGRATTADGTAYNVFDRSLLATNDALYEQMLKLTDPRVADMRNEGVNLAPWCIPKGYRVRAGAQLQ